MTPALLFAALWTAFSVPPYPIERRPFDRPGDDARETARLEAFAAQGEYEAAAFRLKPARALAKVDLRPTALKGPEGAVIGAEEIDVKVVKYWWRPRNSWETDRVGDLEHLVLTPDMLLHDDSLVKADEGNEVNYLRADYPSGGVYLDMRARGRGGHFNYSLEPVHDAPRFVPLDLEAGRCREFFVTFHAPYGTPPGTYEGRLDVTVGGKASGSLALKLEVYPFELPRARTHYDTAREYRLRMFNNLNLAAFLAGGKDLARAEKRLRNTLAECVKHNFLHPFGPGAVRKLDADDLTVRSLLIWRECGLPCDSIVSGHGFDAKWMRKKVGSEKATPENDGAALKEILEKDFTPYVERQLAACEKYLGHRNWRFLGRDEGGPGTQRRQSAFWRVVKDRGAGVFATTMGPMWRQTSWLCDAVDAAARCSPTFADGWHAGGAECYTYAGTFTGIECPDVWRRTKGIRYYFSDFDGVGDYIFFREDVGNCWNGLQPTDSGYRRMMIVFPTEDGFVTTVAFEGLREAMDDVRYYSLHRLLAEKAIRSGDPAKRAAGRKEIAWIDSTDPEFVFDLDAFRREVATRIVALQRLVGKLPPERIVRGPEPPPDACGRAAVPPGKELSAAEGFADANRYDLALPLCEAVRADGRRAFGERVKAAVFEAKLLRTVKRREEALKILADLRPGASGGQALALDSARFDTLLTGVRFEERLDEATLLEAEKAYEAVSAVSKAKHEVLHLHERAMRFIDAAGYGRHGALARRFAEKAGADARFDATRRSALGLAAATASADAGEPEIALKMSAKTEAPALDRLSRPLVRRFLLAMAEAAAATGDRALAARRYGELAATYDPHGEEVAELHRRYRKLAERYSKSEI